MINNKYLPINRKNRFVAGLDCCGVLLAEQRSVGRGAVGDLGIFRVFRI